MFENHRIFKTEIAGRPFTVETGKMAQLANGSAFCSYGDTVVLATATVSAKPREGVDFFPLSVDFEEKLYAVGKIPGSFLKREGRPSEKAILASRVIDRPLRPLFDKFMRNDVSVVCTVMSVDPDCSPVITGLIGASIALATSDIPWKGPIAGVEMGLVDGQIIVNPTAAQRELSQMSVTVAGTGSKVNMIEAGAKEVPEDIVIEAIAKAHEEIKKITAFIDKMVAEIGKPKLSFPTFEVDPEMLEAVKHFAQADIEVALQNVDKTVRDKMIAEVTAKVAAEFAETYPDSAVQLSECIYQLQKKTVRRWLLHDHKRVDGRGIDEIRPLAAEVDVLPRTHGSGMFTRGQTQVLTVATLGAMRDQQLLDGIDDQEYKRYMHHYNFPSYSVGETRPSRGPGRREIGHGALAERALEAVIPSEDEFPYSIRLVSEVLSSNGSTSQGSVCGSTLALMAAGVPIKAPVAGISCGLVTEGDEWITMTDIQGLEDFFGDMDFKVAGTHNGVTAVQVDIKIDGLTQEVIAQAIHQTRDARYRILDGVMADAIEAPRSDVSSYAPKMLTTQIAVDKIREVIGTGGKVIQKIVADTGAQIDVEEDGRIFISAVNRDDAYAALAIIRGIVDDPEVGKIYKGRVVRILPIGAFVEFAPGKEGLVHISKLDNKRVAKVEDVVDVGDEIMVKLMEVDKQGRFNLSRRDAMNAQQQ